MNRVLVAILFLFLPASSLADDLFDIKPVADGIYAAIAKPAYKVNCNAAIVILDDVVLVVDTHSKPSAARVLIEQIKKLTPNPVSSSSSTHIFTGTTTRATKRIPALGPLASRSSPQRPLVPASSNAAFPA
jgi:hypothetical protein